MISKFFEIRDHGTCIAAVAFATKDKQLHDPIQDKFLRRAGYSKEYPLYLLMKLDGESISYDPFSWTNRTMHHAHLFIQDNWDRLKSGDMVDVRVILGEEELNALPEIWDNVDLDNNEDFRRV